MRKRDLDAGTTLRNALIVVLLVVVGLYFALLDWTAPKMQGLITRHSDAKWAPTAHYALGASCFYVGNSDMATEIYRAALGRFPGHKEAPKARFRIAECLERQKKYREAINSYTTFRSRYPNTKYAEAAKDRIDSLGYLVRLNDRRKRR